MALLEKHLVVKKSKIPDAGNGLYTKIFIEKGTRIVEYKGRITTWKEMKDAWENGYIYTINNKHVIDAQRTLKALARYANDGRGITRVVGYTNNCTYVNDGLHAYIESVKDIPAGSEILVAYGKEYWDVVRKNRKIDKSKKSKQANGKAVHKKVNGNKVNGKKVTGKKTKGRKVSSPGKKKSR